MNLSFEGTGAKRCRPLLALEGMRIDYSDEWRSYESIRIQGFNEGTISLNNVVVTLFCYIPNSSEVAKDQED